MPKTIDNPKKEEIVKPSNGDNVTLRYSSPKRLICKVDNGSGLVSTVPEATIDGQTLPTWKFGFGAGEKKEAGISLIQEISITGQSSYNEFTITIAG